MATFLGGVARVRSKAALLLDAVLFNDSLTSQNSAAIDCSGFRRFRLILTMVSDNTPTDIQFIPQFSNDGGVTFHSFLQGLFASLFFEDTVMSSEITEVYSGEVNGSSFRLRVVATGTTATSTFKVTARVEFSN